MTDIANTGIEKESLSELTTLNDNKDQTPQKKKNGLKFLIYFAIIIVATGLALFISLYKDFNGVIDALAQAEYKYLGLIFGLIFISYCIEGFIIFMFSRLYTRKYKFHQGCATAMVGAFYSAVTPGASGGQIMQAYTMKKQGVEASTSASIMIMSFIVYQTALILLGFVGIFFSNGLISRIGTFKIPLTNGGTFDIPAVPLTIAGFILNISVILGLFLMSTSRKIHNFILNHGINLFAKLKIIKKPDEKRESLRIQVENFKIELRRLFSNIPITILVFICYILILVIKFCIPFIAGLALNGYGNCLNLDGSLVIKQINGVYQVQQSIGNPSFSSFWECVFLSSYHQMTTGLIPIPGAAGVSEYFFNIIFANYYVSQQVTSAAQILWRATTFHAVLLISGLITATYHSSPKNEIHHANRKTFVTLQLETYEVRKATANTMYETASLSKKDIQAKLKELSNKRKEKAAENKVKRETKKAELQEQRAKRKKKIKYDSFTTGDDD